MDSERDAWVQNKDRVVRLRVKSMQVCSETVMWLYVYTRFVLQMRCSESMLLLLVACCGWFICFLHWLNAAPYVPLAQCPSTTGLADHISIRRGPPEGPSSVFNVHIEMEIYILPACSQRLCISPCSADHRTWLRFYNEFNMSRVPWGHSCMHWSQSPLAARDNFPPSSWVSRFQYGWDLWVI